jgi:biotin operon repressor
VQEMLAAGVELVAPWGWAVSDCVRDLRNGDFAWFNKAVLQMKLGWKANLAYMGLVSFANGTSQTCFPSKATLADLLGISKTTVYDGLKSLQSVGLISVTERKNGDLSLSNEYSLMPLPHAQYEPPPMRNTNGVVRNTNANKKNEQEETTNTLTLFGDDEIDVRDLKSEVIGKAWDFYKTKFKRNGDYFFSATRKLHGEKAWKSLRSKCNELAIPEDEQAGAILEWLCDAVEFMSADKFHNGQNDNHAKHNDWENLFSGGKWNSPDKLTDYWLNNYKFPNRGVKL